MNLDILRTGRFNTRSVKKSDKVMMILICCPVFSFLLVFQHVEVRAIA